MGVPQVSWIILKLTRLSLVMGMAFIGTFTSPMLRLPDQMALGRIRSSSAGSSFAFSFSESFWDFFMNYNWCSKYKNLSSSDPLDDSSLSTSSALDDLGKYDEA